jgi:nucleotide-binding universal stress UspA family protein
VEFNRILIPVVGNQASDEAVRLACQLKKDNKSKVFAVYVIVVRRSLPIDAELQADIKQGEAILDHSETVAEEEDAELETDLIQARDVGPAIVDQAVELAADLIVIGIEYKRRFGQFSLGDAVPYVLKNAPCRVILYHDYKKAGEAES